MVRIIIVVDGIQNRLFHCLDLLLDMCILFQSCEETMLMGAGIECCVVFCQYDVQHFIALTAEQVEREESEDSSRKGQE